ncbi:MAG: hypothetical protein KF734_22750 [Saprospiraceae bacterium]|nr:hypothetical protein [Saprospiraceae bacterium]
MNNSDEAKATAVSSQETKSIEIDLSTIAKLTFRSSPWLLASIIVALIGSISLPIAKYYELKELITKTNHSIELLSLQIKGEIDLLKEKEKNNKDKKE